MRLKTTKNKFIRRKNWLLLLLCLFTTALSAQNFPVTIEQTNVSCFDANDGRAAVVPQGGTGPYNFFWPMLNATDSILTNLGPGTYRVQVFDRLQNQGSASVTITQPFPLEFDLTTTNVSCFGAMDGRATASPLGGTPPYRYNWSNGGMDASIANLAPGSYGVTVTDANGCNIEDFFRILSPPELILQVSPFNGNCFGTNEGGAVARAIGGVLPYNFVWSNGVTGNSVNGLAPGIYSVTLTDGIQCQQVESFVISEPDSLEFIFVVNDVSCSNQADGSATAIVTGGTAPYTFFWSDGTTGPINSGLSAGSYGVTVFDALQCFNASSITISEPDPLVVTLVKQDISCNGADDGRIDAVVEGGTPPYSFIWTHGPTDSLITDLEPGLYTVEVIDANGCETDVEINIDEPDAIDIDIQLDNPFCFGDSSGQITVRPIGGQRPFRFLWSTGATTSTIDNLAAGRYELTITDDNDCSLTENFELVQPAQLLSNATATAETDVDANDGTASVAPSGGTTPYLVFWSTGQRNRQITGLAPGDYIVSVSDANDCLIVDTVTVNPFGCQLQIEIDSTQIDSLLCFGDANGRIQIQTSGQVDTVFYEWNTGDSTASIENLVAGTYTLIVSDSASCRDTLVIVLPEPPQLQADPIATPETGFNANDGTIAANPSGGTPPYAYLWSTGATDSIITNLVPGIYSLTLTDANDCSVTTRARVASFGCGLVIADISGRDLLCNGDQSGLVQVTPTGGLPPYSYLWNNGAQTDLQTGLSAGTYVVTVSDVTGCLAIDSVQISQPDPLLANLGTTDESFPTANDGSAMVMPSGGTPPYNIFWSTGATGTSISGLSPGSYSVTIFDANDCREEERFLIDAGDFGNCDFDAEAIVRNIRCAGGNDGLIQISVNGTFPPFRFQWNTGATRDVLMGLAAGTYVVSITDQQNCVDTLQLTLLDPPMLLANASATDETSPGANDGTATTAASGGTPPYNVLWSTGATSTAINGLTPGLYTVTVTDGNNCTVSEEVEVRAAGQGNCTLEIFETSQSNVSCFDGSDGRATAFVRGGTPPFQYRWSNGGNTASVSALPAGIYGVTVNDGAGCLDSAELEILQPNELLPNLSSTNESQPNAADGSATVAPSGGTPPYGILWSTGATSTSINGLTPGIYTVTITDANDCTVSEEVEIQAAGQGNCTLEIFETSESNVSCFGGSDGRATAFVRGGTPPFQYSWSNGGNTAALNALPAGTYGVTVNDGAGCRDSAELEILQPTELLVNLNSTNESQPNAADGSASVAPSGGTPPYTVLWSTGGNQLSISNLTPNTYGVTVSDANDCSASRTFEIEEAVCNLEKVREESIAVSCFGESDGSAFVEVRNGFPPYEYNWSDGQDGAIASNLRAATYTLTVTDQAGCRILDTVVVGSPPALIVLIQVESESEVGAGDGSASANVIGGTPPYDIQWFDGSEDAQITGLSNGTYSLTVTDANGCQQMEEFELLGPLNCQTRSGQMDTSQVFFVCGRSEVRATLLGGVVLDNDDVLEFVLHDRNDGELGRVFARSSDPVFRYQSNLQFGQSYFIAALAGNDNGSGQADENDPCLSVSTGVEVSFGKEPVSPYAVQGPEIVCGNESFELEVTDLYPDSSVDYRWILPTGDTLFTEDRFLTITATSTAFTGDYFAIRDSAGCTSSLSPPLFIEVLSLAIEEIDAGADRVVCSDDAISLSALEPSVGSGFWSTTSSAILSTPGMSTTQARDLQGGENVFVWTVVVDECPQAAMDTVIVTREARPIARDDAFVVQRISEEIVLEVILNDGIEALPDTTLVLLSEPEFGRLEYIEEEKAYRYFIDENRRGTVEFTYAICPQDSRCNLPCDSARVQIDILGAPNVPEGLTLNNDGVNDDLQIKGIGGFSRVEILITNRWGNVVYQSKQYDNSDPWRGTYGNSGQPLPQGAYYYLLKAFENGQMVGEPQTGIIHLFTN